MEPSISKIITKEVHERRHHIVLDRHELRRIICEAIALRLITEGATDAQTIAEPTFKFNLDFKAETEGSPAYTVGTRCIVDVVEDRKPSGQN